MGGSVARVVGWTVLQAGRFCSPSRESAEVEERRRILASRRRPLPFPAAATERWAQLRRRDGMSCLAEAAAASRSPSSRRSLRLPVSCPIIPFPAAAREVGPTSAAGRHELSRWAAAAHARHPHADPSACLFPVCFLSVVPDEFRIQSTRRICRTAGHGPLPAASGAWPGRCRSRPAGSRVLKTRPGRRVGRCRRPGGLAPDASCGP